MHSINGLTRVRQYDVIHFLLEELVELHLFALAGGER